MDANVTKFQSLNAIAKAFGDEPLLILPDGQIINLAEGYITLQVNFTIEDKAAKGLRKRGAGDVIESPVYFSALELVSDNKILLLTGPSGGGKSTFAKYLAFSLATSTEVRCVSNAKPYYWAIDGPDAFITFLEESLSEVVDNLQATSSGSLFILDTVENLGVKGTLFLTQLLTLTKQLGNIKVLLLGDSSIIKQWVLPAEIVRHDLRTLSVDQKRQMVGSLMKCELSEVSIGLGQAAATPAFFALALEARHSGDCAEKLLDAWVAVSAPGTDASELLTAHALMLHDNSLIQGNSSSSLATSPTLFSSKAVQRLLAARHLVNLPIETSLSLFRRDSINSEPIIRSLIARLGPAKRQSLLRGLLSGSKIELQAGALLVSDFATEFDELHDQVSCHMLAIVQEGILTIVQREKAGRVLSRFGDPRDLTILAEIPAGEFVLGSEDHANSRPLATVSLKAFQISVYPVVNRDYLTFVQDTGRSWRSPDGLDTETQNAPATDLTWYDAIAYCEWLTCQWQSVGKISLDEYVRLPSEPEWEVAARGHHQSSTGKETIFPWGTEWTNDAANYEETGFNRRVSVGLFPVGRSPFGCYDMVGQVWEWCTTLWGVDMATPSFSIPGATMNVNI